MKNSAMLCSVPSEEEEDDDNEDDEDDEDDDGGVVPQKMYEEVQRKYHHYHGLYRGLRLQLEETKKKLEEQQRLYTEVEEEHKIIRKLNIDLQQQLLCTLNSSLSSKSNDPGDKTLTGKTSPTTKTSGQPLTPQQLQTLKVCFREWLQSKNVDDTEIQARCGKAGRYITEKIMDINKQKTQTTTPN
ncbi:hypothetical protein ABVT39_006452 [Epinephelus coioides]